METLLRLLEATPEPPQVNPPEWLYWLTCSILGTIILAGLISDWRAASKNRK